MQTKTNFQIQTKNNKWEGFADGSFLTIKPIQDQIKICKSRSEGAVNFSKTN